MWELNYKVSWVLKNWYFWTVVLEKTLGIPLDCKEIKPVNPKGNQSWIFIHWKDWCWSWNSNALATWCEELTYLKRPWCWERLKAGGDGVDRGWDRWMVSPIPSTWVLASSGRWWKTGKSDMLQSIGSQQTEHNWVTEEQQQQHFSSYPIHLHNTHSFKGCVILFNTLFNIFMLSQLIL